MSPRCCVCVRLRDGRDGSMLVSADEATAVSENFTAGTLNQNLTPLLDYGFGRSRPLGHTAIGLVAGTVRHRAVTTGSG
jgi:hypothetical protein